MQLVMTISTMLGRWFVSVALLRWVGTPETVQFVAALNKMGLSERLYAAPEAYLYPAA
jgi:hypothetical protein